MPCRPIASSSTAVPVTLTSEYIGQVGQVHAEPDHGGLVAHRVHPGQRRVHRRRVAHVANDEVTCNMPKGGRCARRG